MSIISFVNEEKKETGQSLSASAIATCMAIEHNYKVLLISTDFNDKTIEDCFWPKKQKNIMDFINTPNRFDISSGLEGLIRTFASNRASNDMINSYTKPILRNRLDVLPGPCTVDYKEYCTLSTYFSQIADVANKSYDIVIVDLSNQIPDENQKKLLMISDLILIGLNQNMTSINSFLQLQNEDDFFRRSNVILSIGKYNSESKYTNKNVARYLREKNIPLIIPYNILFSDYCSEGKIVDYLLMSQLIKDKESKEFYFYNTLKDTIENIDFFRKQHEYEKM
jgi:cellulose biosynthesis protein BcsQ